MSEDTNAINEAKVLPIIKWPHSTLHTMCQPVETFEQRHINLISNMKSTLIHHDGLGLAAPQVGSTERIIIVRQSLEDDIVGSLITMINPQLTDVDDSTMFSWKEGCLSVPGYYEQRQRPGAVTVQYYDINQQAQEKRMVGLHAFIVQHEIDHLNGKVFVDNLSAFKQSRIKTKIKKTLQRGKNG